MCVQVCDILIYNDKTLGVSSEPLHDYLEQNKLPHKLISPHTACWRGYTAKFAIDNKKLFLIGWEGYILDYQKVGIEYLFPGEEFVFANWFTGKIRIEVGNVVSYRLPYIYEGNLFLVFENGVLIEEYFKWLTAKEIDKIIKEEEALPF